MSEATVGAETASAAWPVLLLPVRLETRYTADALLLRVYPDDVHVDSHEPELTQDEADAAQQYWDSLWTSGGDGSVETAAWALLAGRFGAERAAWVARVTEPLNPQDRPQPGTDPSGGPGPQLPDVPRREATWTRRAVARALPSRWEVLARPVAAGAPAVRVTGAPIPSPLPVGPDPRGDLPQDPAAPPTDEATRWLVDFHAAEAVGMAVRLPLPAGGAYASVVVWGRRDEDPAASVDELAALLTAQYHTRGLGYVPPGAPTNNTETVTSAFSRSSAEHRAAYRVGLADPVPADGDARAARLGAALGLPLVEPHGIPGRAPAGSAAPLARAQGAAAPDESHARAAQTALWGTTWGYYLDQFLAGRLTADAVDGARNHARDHLRPGGPLPTLRMGMQPYGVLPVLVAGRWTDVEGGAPGSGLDPGVVGFLQRLRAQVWEPSADDGVAVPRVRRDDPRPEWTLSRLLAMSPTARRIFGRNAVGEEYVSYLWRFADLALREEWRSLLAQGARSLGERLGVVPFDVRLGRVVFARESFPLDVPWSRSDGVEPRDYLSWLSAAGRTAEEVRDAPDRGTPATTPLLYRLLRHSLLVETARAADRLLATSDEERVEPELVDVIPGETTPTVWRRLRRVPEWLGVPVGDRLASADSRADAGAADLWATRDAIAALADVPVADLDRLLAETLDGTSHRLDAWFTSLATRRLHWLRRADGGRPDGLHLGGYGWLLDVRPRPVRPVVPADEVPPGEEPPPGAPPLTRVPDAAGTLHAPSLPQASTAAVLRAGHRAHAAGSANGSAGPLAVSLPSARVRAAADLLDAVRAGQPVGAVLGYRVERTLQDSPVPTMASYVPRLRALAPLRGTVLEPDGTLSAGVVGDTVVDGLALHRLRLAGRLDATKDIGVPVGADDERAAIVAVLDDLADAVDAVSDALLVEGVHQAVLGNPLRAGATLDAVGRGEAPPPELESQRTPRTGLALTHRVLTLLPVDRGADRTAWPVDADVQARAVAAPEADAWASLLLPAPSRVRVRVQVDPPAAGATGNGAAAGGGSAVEVALSDLRLSALDLLALGTRALPATAPGSSAAAPIAVGSDLERLVLRQVAGRPEVPAGARLRLLPDPDGAGGSGDGVSAVAFLEAARAAHDLLASTRPVGAVDLDRPEAASGGPTGGPAPEELRGRWTTVGQRVTDAMTALVDPGRRADGLVRAALLGVPGVLPGPDAGPAELEALARTAGGELADRLERATAGLPGTSGVPDTAAVVAALEALLGPGAPVLPPVPVPTALSDGLGASDELQGGDPTAAAGWLPTVARVRRGADRLARSLQYAEALGAQDGLTLGVAQLPHRAGDRWLGLPHPPSAAGGHRLSLLVHAPAGMAATVPAPGGGSGAVCGVVVDEWTELLPGARETTGVVLHVDSPDASPPQVLLLAVPPDARSTWDPDLLGETVEEALALARIRAVDLEALHPVDPDALTDIGQLGPAALLAMNVVPGDAVSTDLSAALPRTP